MLAMDWENCHSELPRMNLYGLPRIGDTLHQGRSTIEGVDAYNRVIELREADGQLYRYRYYLILTYEDYCNSRNRRPRF